jgi:hypothetical protein
MEEILCFRGSSRTTAPKDEGLVSRPCLFSIIPASFRYFAPIFHWGKTRRDSTTGSALALGWKLRIARNYWVVCPT